MPKQNETPASFAKDIMSGVLDIGDEAPAEVQPDEAPAEVQPDEPAPEPPVLSDKTLREMAAGRDALRAHEDRMKAIGR